MHGEFQNTNPERGRKRYSLHEFVLSPKLNFRTRTPKGDGNRCLPLVNYFFTFQNTNPERGRKHCQFVSEVQSNCIFQNTNPERGRNQACDQVGGTLRNFNFRTRTPKGDGNLLLDLGIRPGIVNISEHEPRKGTETARKVFDDHSFDMEFQNTNPERGRKPVVVFVLRRLALSISEHEPRKGTETKRLVP